MENKRTTSSSRTAAPAGSRVRRDALQLLKSNPGSRFYVRQLHRLLGGSIGTLHRELRKLEASGLVSSERVGTLRFYFAGGPGGTPTARQAGLRGAETGLPAEPGEGASPAFAHLDTDESIALERAIHAVRAVFGPAVKIAVFGSKVRGDAGPESDLDVLVVVSEKDPRKIDQFYDLVLDVELEHAARLSFTILTDEEYARNEALHSPFVEAVEREGIAV